MDIQGLFHSHHISIFLILTFCSLILYHSIRFLFVNRIHEQQATFLGTMSQNIGLLYGIVLAFLVVMSWQNFNFLQSTIVNESTQIGALWRDSLAFDHDTQGKLSVNIVNYLNSIGSYEWPRMKISEVAIENPAYDALWDGFLNINPTTETQKIFLQSAAQHLDNISELRRTRIGASTTSLPFEVWGLLIFGAICSLFITMIFEYIDLWLRYMIAGLEFVLIFITFALINAFDNPYTSFLALDTKAYQHTVEIITHSSVFVSRVKN